MRFSIAAALVLAAEAAWAAAPFIVTTQAGKDAPIGVYAVVRSDCSVGSPPDIRVTRPPAHGAVVVQDAQLAARGAEPCALGMALARRVTYRPAAGYTGQDELVFEIVDRTTGQIDPHPVTVVVQPAPASI